MHRLTLLLFLLMPSLLLAQNGALNAQGQYENRILNDSIASVTFHQKGLPLTLPVWMIGSPEVLRLEFDELGEYAENYSYSIELEADSGAHRF